MGSIQHFSNEKECYGTITLTHASTHTHNKMDEIENKKKSNKSQKNI
jgi:hypothetical protein